MAAVPGETADLITPVARVEFSSSVEIRRAATDPSGNTYLVGTRLLEGLSAPPYQARSVFVAKFDASGNSVYALTIGGKGNDFGLGIAADREGNAFVVGSTTSSDFPVRNAVQNSGYLGGPTRSGFVLKLGSDGTLLWSTYFGGPPYVLGSSVNAVAVDDFGNAYITGDTDSWSLITTAGAFQTHGSGVSITRKAYAFVAKFSPDGKLAYSTYLGGSYPNCYGGSTCSEVDTIQSAVDIAVDSSGNARITGHTNATDFPAMAGTAPPKCSIVPDPIASYGDSPDIPFAAGLNSTGSALIYSVRLCGTRKKGEGTPTANALALDSQGNTYIIGTAGNSGFPTTTGAFQSKLSGVSNAFVTKLDSTGNLVFSTLLGGMGSDSATSVRIASDGSILVAGSTNSPDFPDTAGQFPAGAAFLTHLDPQGSHVLSSVRLPAGVTDAGILPASGSSTLLAGASGLISQFIPDGSPASTILGAGNAATAGIQSAVPSGALISIYGIGIGPQDAASVPAVDGRLPTSWNDIAVLMDGRPAPLLYVSANQINAVSIHSQTATVQIMRNGMETGSFRIGVRGSNPQIFRHPDGSAIAVNQDGTLNSASNPARGGSVVAVWGTGDDLCFDIAAPDTMANQAYQRPGEIQINDQASVYAGCAPGAVGAVFQVNFRVFYSPLIVFPTLGLTQDGWANLFLSGALQSFGSEPFLIWVKP
jgi:uncharacterized protein (TIGR03437 family)